MLIRVRVTPNIKTESVVEFSDGSFEISVKEKAEQNKANIRTRELVAEHFGLEKADVRIVNGHRLKGKLLEIKG